MHDFKTTSTSAPWMSMGINDGWMTKHQSRVLPLTPPGSQLKLRRTATAVYLRVLKFSQSTSQQGLNENKNTSRCMSPHMNTSERS